MCMCVAYDLLLLFFCQSRRRWLPEGARHKVWNAWVQVIYTALQLEFFLGFPKLISAAAILNIDSQMVALHRFNQ